MWAYKNIFFLLFYHHRVFFKNNIFTRDKTLISGFISQCLCVHLDFAHPGHNFIMGCCFSILLGIIVQSWLPHGRITFMSTKLLTPRGLNWSKLCLFWKHTESSFCRLTNVVLLATYFLLHNLIVFQSLQGLVLEMWSCSRSMGWRIWHEAQCQELTQQWLSGWWPSPECSTIANQGKTTNGLFK